MDPGIADALAIARESVGALALDRQTQTVTSKQLAESLDGVAALLDSAPATPAGVAERLELLRFQADTAADIARTLIGERGDDAGVLYWTEALRSCVQAHARDLELFAPWARTHAEAPAFASLLASMPTLASLPGDCEAVIEALEPDDAHAPALVRTVRGARALAQRLAAIGDQARELAATMDFGFLFDRERQLLSIGYRIADGSLDPSCYDLLASEARLASFVAIAKGDVPPYATGSVSAAFDHAGRQPWVGAGLVVRLDVRVSDAVARHACAAHGSLLEQTNRMIVRRHHRLRRLELGLPWGISESAYNARDLELSPTSTRISAFPASG